MAAFALTGCGARDSLAVEGGPPAGNSIVLDICDGSEGLILLEPSCTLDWSNPPAPVFSIFFSKPDLPNGQPGAVFKVGQYPAPVSGQRFSATGIESVTGEVELTTYDPHGGATGSYQLEFAEGSAAGTFSADRCSNPCSP